MLSRGKYVLRTTKMIQERHGKFVGLSVEVV
jgi:hypothetical protein